MTISKIYHRYHRLIPWISIAIVLGIASYLRLFNISGYMTFLGDEGRDVLIVKRMIVDHKFTLLGPTASVGGFFMGPIYYYFMAPFLWLSNLDPTGPAVMVALFGIATVYLVYKTGKEFFNEFIGLVAASLYALSPITIAYSRSSWNPNLVPFFSLCVIYNLWRVVAKNQWRHIIWVGIALGIGLQLHYLFFFLMITVFVWFFIMGRSLQYIKYYGLAIVGFIMGYSLFLAFELRHGFPNTQSIVRFILEGKDTGFSLASFLGTIIDVVFRLFGRLVLRLPQGEIWNQFPGWQMSSWINGTYGMIVLSTVCVGLSVYIYKRNKISRLFSFNISKDWFVASVLLLVWLAVPLILFGFYRRAIYDYYFGIFFPLPFLLVGIFLWFIGRVRYGYILSFVIWVGLMYLNWQGRPFLYAPNNQLAQTKRIAQVAYEKTDGKPYNFALIADRNSDHAFRYFFEIWGNIPVTIENEQIDPQRKTVTDQLIVMCDNYNCQPLGHPLWEIAGFGRAEIAGTWEVPFVKIFKLVHYHETY